jgi:hypothetical protein
MPLTNGSGSWNKLFLKSFSVLLLFESTFTSFFKYKKSKRSHKTVGIKVFLTILLDRRIQESQKHMDPTDPDPDPQHCSQGDVPDRNYLKRLVPDLVKEGSRPEVTKFPNIW